MLWERAAPGGTLCCLKITFSLQFDTLELFLREQDIHSFDIFELFSPSECIYRCENVSRSSKWFCVGPSREDQAPRRILKSCSFCNAWSLSLTLCLFFILSEWSPDRRLLMVDDSRWRSATRGSSCSSMEPSMSSFTNGTHSSLNSEMEEEELICSVEPSVQYNTYRHFSNHANGENPRYCKKCRKHCTALHLMWQGIHQNS